MLAPRRGGLVPNEQVVKMMEFETADATMRVESKRFKVDFEVLWPDPRHRDHRRRMGRLGAEAGVAEVWCRLHGLGRPP